MAYSEVGICNLALVLLRADKIASFEESTVARACGTLYPACRDRLLELADWTFARKYVELIEIIDDTVVIPDNYTLYSKPADCMVPRIIVPRGQPRALVSVWDEIHNYIMVSSNVSQPCLFYTAAVTDAGRFTSGFIHLLTLDLASRGALPIARDKAMASQYAQQFLADQADIIGRDANRGFLHPNPQSNPNNDSFVTGSYGLSTSTEA
jgi:hypothetical protein